MRPRFATCSRTLAVPAFLALALLAACSGSNRDTPATPPPAAADTQTASATPRPSPRSSAPTPAERLPVDQGAPTPAETPIVPTPAPETREAKQSPTPTEATHDPLKEMEEKEQRRVAYEQELTRLAAARAAAAEDVALREKDLLAFKNPYLARPKLKPDEADQINGMGGAERATWAEGRVADAKAALEAATKAYDDAKANPPN